MTQYNTIKKIITYVNGYYGTSAVPHEFVDNEVVKVVGDLENHRSSNCWVLYTPKFVYLQSYNTIVSKYDRLTGEIVESKHSVTTSKQQSWFAHQMNATKRTVVDKV